MIKINATYEGGLHCSLVHGPSGSTLSTDAPLDNHGKGESFSPTDLVAASLGSCMLTVMGIFAERHKINLFGASATVTKMIQEPVRRIGKLTVVIQFPKGIDLSQRQPLERAALSCPVHKSLHPDIQIPVNFQYSD